MICTLWTNYFYINKDKKKNQNDKQLLFTGVLCRNCVKKLSKIKKPALNGPSECGSKIEMLDFYIRRNTTANLKCAGSSLGSIMCQSIYKTTY